MTLDRAFRSLKDGEPFIGDNEKEYTDALVRSISPVMQLREDIGVQPFHYLTLLRPGLILAEPALYRFAYKRMQAKGPLEQKIAARVMRMIQTQKKLATEVDKDFLTEFQGSSFAQHLMYTRASELRTFSCAVGLHAAQTTAAVMRMSPAVNHVFSSLSNYARSIRSSSVQNRIKSKRLFDEIQNGLSTALGEERISLIKKDGGPLKLISDAPIEWLPIDGLPMSMRYDCSRINATPGNLLMALLSIPRTLTFTPKELQKVLIVSSFEDGDALKNMMRRSVDSLKEIIKDKVTVTIKSVKSEAEFVEALNAYDGNIVVFDGHGIDNADDPISRLAIGKDSVDVWQLRGRVRVPPIVILSACDTHTIDASTQATVGNGFLMLGTRTVLATLLPVDGMASAAFVGRLLYRLADFVPAAMSARERVLNWTEIVSGMLRMTLATEILDGLIGPPTSDRDSPRGKLQLQANKDINIRETDQWYERLIDGIAKQRGDAVADIARKAGAIVARSDSIRYVQLGHPETILVDDGQIEKRVMEQYGTAANPDAAPDDSSGQSQNPKDS